MAPGRVIRGSREKRLSVIERIIEHRTRARGTKRSSKGGKHALRLLCLGLAPCSPY